MITQDTLAYRTSPGFSLHAEGRWLTGGAVQIFYHALLVDQLSVPKSEWSVLALLIEAARLSETGHRAAAFVPTAKLALELQRRAGLGGCDPENLHRVIMKLRRRLTRGAAQELAETEHLEWDRNVIEKHPTLGYRLSLPPDVLHLVLLNEEGC
jgi:hypothetical protein